jgi:hypothetical protein
LLLLVASGCRDTTVQVPGVNSVATSVSVTPIAARIIPGDSVRLTAIARDSTRAEVQGATYSWTSRRTRVATVSSTGMVHGEPLGAGVSEDTAWIIVTTGALRDSARVVVTEPGSLGAPRMGINLDMVNDWSTEWPFTDLFRASRRWISQRTGAPWGGGGPLALTSDNWVASLDADQRERAREELFRQLGSPEGPFELNARAFAVAVTPG